MSNKNIDISGLSRMQMRNLVKQISDLGENGDTELAHINKDEKALLISLGGSGKINSQTGVPGYGYTWKRFGADWNSFWHPKQKHFSEKFGGTKNVGLYKKLQDLGIKQPTNYSDMQAMLTQTGKYASLKGISKGKIIEYLKFKQSGGPEATKKKNSEWNDITDSAAGGFDARSKLNDLIQVNKKNIANQRMQASLASNKTTNQLPNIQNANVSVGNTSNDIWAKGAEAQTNIDTATSRSARDATSAAQTAALSQFTDLFG